MTIKHATTKAPGDTLAAVADWNAEHTQPTATLVGGLCCIGPYGIAGLQVTSNTVMIVGRVIVPFKIVVNNIAIQTGSGAVTPSTWDIALFSEDGQTKIFEVTTATLSSSLTVYTTAVPTVTVEPGIYYITAVANGSVNQSMGIFRQNQTVSPQWSIATKPLIEGTITVTAGTIPATIDPTAITPAAGRTLMFLLIT